MRLNPLSTSKHNRYHFAMNAFLDPQKVKASKDEQGNPCGCAAENALALGGDCPGGGSRTGGLLIFQRTLEYSYVKKRLRGPFSHHRALKASVFSC